MSPTFNFNLLDAPAAVAAALILIAGGSGTFAVVRRNQRRARQRDLEAVELEVTHAVPGGVAPGSAHNAGAPGITIAAEALGAAVPGAIRLSVSDDRGAAGQGGATVIVTLGGRDDQVAAGAGGETEGSVTTEGSATLGGGGDEGAAGEGGAMEISITLGGGDDEGVAGEGGAMEDDIALGGGDYEGALEVYGAVDNGVDLGVDAST